MAADYSAAHRHEISFRGEIASPGADCVVAQFGPRFDPGLYLRRRSRITLGKIPIDGGPT